MSYIGTTPGQAGTSALSTKADATQDGYLSSADWNTFNNKQPAGSYLTAVSANAPLTGSGTANSHLSIPAATSQIGGYLSSADWNTFNNKQNTLVSGESIKTINGMSLLGSGDIKFPGVYLVSGTDRYDATSMGPVLSVDVIANYYASGILPSSGRLTYILAKNDGNQEVTVSYRKTGSTISQSAFTLSGNTLTYTGDTQSILLYANDDHDSLFVDASGAGILSRASTDSLLSGTWDKFRGSTELVTNSALNSVLTYPFASNAESNASIVSFPGTNSAVLLNLTAGTYKVNNGDVRSMPAPLNAIANSSTWSSPANSLWTISDGINQFMIGRYGSSTAYVVTVDLMSYAITVGSIALSATPSVNNATEEDCIGTQLFSIDGVATWLVGTTYYYGGALDWKTNLNVFNTSGKSSFTAGSVATQTGMDIWGSIDNSGYVWFADWGHDDGGLFGIGNDDRLNTRPTNIKYVTK